MNTERRQRLHDLLLALIAREEGLPLMDQTLPGEGSAEEPARWLDQNRRTLQRYQEAASSSRMCCRRCSIR